VAAQECRLRLSKNLILIVSATCILAVLAAGIAFYKTLSGNAAGAAGNLSAAAQERPKSANAMATLERLEPWSECNVVFKNDVLNVDPAARADARVVQVWIDLDLDLDELAPAKQVTNLTVDVLITASPPSS
jgi:hypothetical protein